MFGGESVGARLRGFAVAASRSEAHTSYFLNRGSSTQKPKRSQKPWFSIPFTDFYLHSWCRRLSRIEWLSEQLSSRLEPTDSRSADLFYVQGLDLISSSGSIRSETELMGWSRLFWVLGFYRV